jgi:hypothetical protein
MSAAQMLTWKRKYLTIVIPITLCVICGLFQPKWPVGLFTTMLFIGLISQNFMFQWLFTDSIYEYSEQMAKKPIPSFLQSRFGAGTTAIIVVSSKYLVGIALVGLITLFEVLPTPNLITTVLLSMSLGFILSPIVENLFMIQSTTDIININVIGATYIVTLLIGIAGIPALTGEVNSIWTLPGEIVLLYLTYVFLLARAHHIIHVAFNQQTGLLGFAISLIPLALFVLPQIQYIANYI